MAKDRLARLKNSVTQRITHHKNSRSITRTVGWTAGELAMKLTKKLGYETPNKLKLPLKLGLAGAGAIEGPQFFEGIAEAAQDAPSDLLKDSAEPAAKIADDAIIAGSLVAKEAAKHV